MVVAQRQSLWYNETEEVEMTTKFTHIKHHSRSIGRDCMHCGRPATVTAVRKQDNKLKLPVRYCDEHAEIRGVFETRGAA